MAFQSKAGNGVLDDLYTDSGGAYEVAFATGSTDDVELRPDQTNVLISNTSSSDCNIYLPPVAEARGRTFTFLKTDSGTQSVLLKPASWVSGLNGGDSINWEGGTGYDFDAQYDNLVLISNGVSWINPATAAIS